MIVSILRSRLKPDIAAEYAPVARRMSELAVTIPGYVSHKAFVAEDGERLTVVEFETMEALEVWRRHPEHMDAKRAGYKGFYTDFSYQICELKQARTWQARPEAGKTT